MDGIYISNIYFGKKINELKKTFLQNIDNDDFAIPFEKNSLGNSNSVNQNLELQEIRQYIQTRITFNKGIEWKRIKAPLKDAFGSDINCDINKNCALHLHSMSSKK